MVKKTSRATRSLSRNTLELAMAAPVVVAHRVGRMAAAGAHPSARDRDEFALMFSEKRQAFGQAGVAMMVQSAMTGQRLAWSLMRSFWLPWLYRPMTPAAQALEMQRAAQSMLAKGLAPVHRVATANAKALGVTAGDPASRFALAGGLMKCLYR